MMPEKAPEFIESVVHFPQAQQAQLHEIGGGGTYSDMDRIWEKLREHDKRFDRIESELSNAKYWFVGTALAIGLAGIGLVYAAQQNTTATMGAALSAIQTVISAQPAQPAPVATPQQPTIIVVPMDRSPVREEAPPQ